MRIVLDTNVLISAFLWGGKPKIILDRVFDGKDQLFISKEILDEIFNVLSRERCQLQRRLISLFVREIEEVSELVFPSERITNVVRDVKDHMILECALESEADFIITSDKDLLVLKEFEAIGILQVAEFLVYCPRNN
jgi:uncharacterized protein